MRSNRMNLARPFSQLAKTEINLYSLFNELNIEILIFLVQYSFFKGDRGIKLLGYE